MSNDSSDILHRKSSGFDHLCSFICDHLCWSKTIQFKERKLLIPIVRLPPGRVLCPVEAYVRPVRLFPPHPPRLPFCTPRELVLAQ